MEGHGPGSRTASGLFYQYLFTIETFLALVDHSWPDDAEVRIEDPLDPNVVDPDIVDFSVYSEAGVLQQVHQAKSVAIPKLATISAGDALVTLVRMVNSNPVDDPLYILTTNARPGLDIEELNTLLGGDRPDAEVLHALGVIVHNNTEATAALSTITGDAQIRRLRRARVNATGESSRAIRRRIRAKLHTWRREHGLPLSNRAARILESELIKDVFSRAADTYDDGDDAYDDGDELSLPQDRSVPLHKFRALLAEPAEVLAQVAAQCDTGSGAERAPSGDGIARPDKLALITDRFNNIRSRRIQQCVLTGPSGSGKTRLAAMYVHSEADSYDRVTWIDGESSASIVSSIVKQSTIIGISNPESTGDADVIADAFKGSISGFIGRWLIVFDNAHDARGLQPWMPTRGNADVLVTSTDSANWTEHQPVRVRGMAADQARELLISRLEDDVPDPTPQQRDRLEDALERLAIMLDHRPLALHMAASHFGSLSVLIAGIDSYTGKIDALADLMDDDDLDRGEYPRTFQAAIEICFERLLGDSTVAALVATDMLAVSSVLASRSIPAYLAFAVATRSSKAVYEGSDPLAELEQQLPLMNAAIGQIRTQSLMERSNEPGGDSRWELSVQLEINEIVQYVLRRRLPRPAAVMDNAAAHLSVWLADAIDRQDFPSALALQPHALQLLALAKEAPAVPGFCAILAGNEANLRLIQGRPHEALAWLRFEMVVLKQQAVPHYKTMAKTADQILEAVMRIGWSVAQVLPEIRSACQYLHAAVDEGTTAWDGDRICGNLVSVIKVLTQRSTGDQDLLEELAALRNTAVSLLAHFPDSGAAARLAQHTGAEDALSEGRLDEALALATDLLAGLGTSDHLERLDVKALRIEILCNQDDIDRLEIEVADFRDELERHPDVVKGVWASLIDTAHRLAILIAVETADTTKHRRIFTDIVRASRTLCTNDYEHYAHALLAGCEASQRQDITGVRLLQDLAAARKPADPTIGQQLGVAHTWLQYWLECAEQGHAARAYVAGVRGRRPSRDSSGRARLTIEVSATALADELPHDGARLQARHRTDISGRTRGFDIRDTVTARPLAYLLFGELPADAFGEPDPQFRIIDNGTTIRPTHLLLELAVPPDELELLIALH